MLEDVGTSSADISLTHMDSLLATSRDLHLNYYLYYHYH